MQFKLCNHCSFYQMYSNVFVWIQILFSWSFRFRKWDKGGEVWLPMLTWSHQDQDTTRGRWAPRLTHLLTTHTKSKDAFSFESTTFLKVVLLEYVSNFVHIPAEMCNQQAINKCCARPTNRKNKRDWLWEVSLPLLTGFSLNTCGSRIIAEWWFERDWILSVLW